jgi:hypothetical protein
VKGLPTSAKLVGAIKVKCAVVSTLVSLAFGSQAFAVLRPPFPDKPAAPFDGELIIIGDDLEPESASGCAAGAKNYPPGLGDTAGAAGLFCVCGTPGDGEGAAPCAPPASSARSFNHAS